MRTLTVNFRRVSLILKEQSGEKVHMCVYLSNSNNFKIWALPKAKIACPRSRAETVREIRVICVSM